LGVKSIDKIILRAIFGCKLFRFDAFMVWYYE